MEMISFSFRYIVDNVPDAIIFYTNILGFKVVMNPNKHFAILTKEGLKLMLSTPTGRGGGARAMLDNRKPEPGGWNRIQIRVNNLENEMAELKQKNVHFRSDLITGIGAKQIIIDDPSGNPIEINELLPL
jgi:catechol 2,3-dioxygenase-like lactoylglutathione lyase family enzyme